MFFVELFFLNVLDLVVGVVEFLFLEVDALVLVLLYLKFMPGHVKFMQLFLLLSQMLFHFLHRTQKYLQINVVYNAFVEF
jgi:hypothetical protein